MLNAACRMGLRECRQKEVQGGEEQQPEQHSISCRTDHRNANGGDGESAGGGSCLALMQKQKLEPTQSSSSSWSPSDPMKQRPKPSSSIEELRPASTSAAQRSVNQQKVRKLIDRKVQEERVGRQE